MVITLTISICITVYYRIKNLIVYKTQVQYINGNPPFVLSTAIWRNVDGRKILKIKFINPSAAWQQKNPQRLYPLLTNFFFKFKQINVKVTPQIRFSLILKNKSLINAQVESLISKKKTKNKQTCLCVRWFVCRRLLRISWQFAKITC